MTLNKLLKDIETMGIDDVKIQEGPTEEPDVIGFYKKEDSWVVYKTSTIGYEHILGKCEKKGEAVEFIYNKMKARVKHKKWLEKISTDRVEA